MDWNKVPMDYDKVVIKCEECKKVLKDIIEVCDCGSTHFSIKDKKETEK